MCNCKDESQVHYAGRKKPDKKGMSCTIPFGQNSRKCVVKGQGLLSGTVEGGPRRNSKEAAGNIERVMFYVN